MRLQEMVNDVKRLNDTAVLVTFDNNVTRVYEQKREGIVADAVAANANHVRGGRYLSWGFSSSYPRLIRDEGYAGYFSDEVVDAVGSLAKQDHFYSQKVDKKIDETFEEVIKSLDLNLRTARDWKGIGSGLSIGLLTPIVTPVGLVASMFVSGQKNGTGPNLAMLALAPPAMGYQAVRELVSPRSQYLALGDQKVVTADREESMPAVSFNGKPGKFSSMGLRFATGDVGCISPAYHPEEGESAVTAYILPTNVVMKNWERGQYAVAGQFLRLDDGLNGNMNRFLEERTRFAEVQEQFVASLNYENQEALLKSIGFL